MSGLGTDLVALACILGGAVTGGGMTMALLHDNDSAPADCAVEAMSLGSQIVVSGDAGARAIVLSRPHLELRQTHRCGAMVVGHVSSEMDQLRQEMVEARVRMELRQRQMGEARHMVLRIREAEALAAEAGAQGANAEAQLEAVQILLEKVEKGSGGRMD